MYILTYLTRHWVFMHWLNSNDHSLKIYSTTNRNIKKCADVYTARQKATYTFEVANIVHKIYMNLLEAKFFIEFFFMFDIYETKARGLATGMMSVKTQTASGIQRRRRREKMDRK